MPAWMSTVEGRAGPYLSCHSPHELKKAEEKDREELGGTKRSLRKEASCRDLFSLLLEPLTLLRHSQQPFLREKGWANVKKTKTKMPKGSVRVRKIRRCSTYQ